MPPFDLKRVEGGWRCRLRHGGGKRDYFLIPAPAEETDNARAVGIAQALQQMGARLSAAGRDPGEVKEYMQDAAGDSADKAAFARYEKRAAALPTAKEGDAERVPLFREVAADWLSGKLNKRYPDDVGAIKPKTYAKYQSCLVLINRLIGDKAVNAITLEDAEKVKEAIPEGRTQSTRRAYALVIRKVLSLCEYPLKHIERSPIPRKFVPPQGKSPAFGFLYPAEEELLLGHMVSLRHATNGESFDDAVMYGVLHREGMRAGEAAMLTVSDIDFESGEISLDDNKTDDPRTWAMGHDVAIALKIYVGDAGPDDLVFPNFVMRHAATKFRTYIAGAGIERKGLSAGVNRRAIRLHDARASFITVALAIGMTETWVMDRTGHQSSDMVNKYRRQMRHVKTLGLSWFAPLNECLGYGAAATLPRGPRVAHRFTVQPDLAAAASGAENPQFAAQGYGGAPEALNTQETGSPGGHEVPPRPAAKQGVAQGGQGVAHEATGLANVGAGAPDTAHQAVSPTEDTAAPAAGAPEADGPVERALAAALHAAIEHKQWDLALEVTRELGERRRARTAPTVPSLSDARAKREKGEGK